MSRFSTVRFSLKARLMFIIGSITALLMLLISVGILSQWRTMIVGNLRQNAEGVTRAIAISLTDAFLYGDEEDPPLEDLLERYIHNYTSTIAGLTHIAVIDNGGRILAHSDHGQYGRVVTDSLGVASGRTDRLITAILELPRHGWVIETVQPLRIAGKRWGVVRVGFSAESTRAEIRSLFILLVALTTLVTTVTLLVLYLLIGRLTGSLHELVLLMDGTGLEADEPVPVPRRNDEVGFLLQHFGLLRQRLSQSRRELLSVHAQIARAEKLASIGRLASGVAHEINNPLHGIKNCLYAMEREPENRQQILAYLPLIREGMEYIETVVQKLLGFARQQPASMQDVSLPEVLSKVLRLLDYNIRRKRATCTLTVDPCVPIIRGDPHLLSEVMMNLVLNAVDAVDDGGLIVLRCSAAGEHRVSIHVQDNGTGIPEEHLARIFDPFFTTKGPKEGTGLGLSVALGVVETHGGTIRVSSAPGQGSTFVVELPVGEGRA
jgi:signal transduction histidine kinase